MTSMQSDSESNVSGFIHYSNKNFKHLYTSMIENMELINQDLLEIEKNLTGIVKKAGPFESNWVEDLIECTKVGSLYIAPKEDIDYEKMKPESRSLDLRQNKLVGVQGLGLYTVICHDSHVHCGNYTTTTDLVYNHMPKPLCGPPKRYYKKSAHTWYPQPDLMHCYGDNLTKTGLRAEKRLEWRFTDVSDWNPSQYEDTYLAPSLNQYLKAAERKARDSYVYPDFVRVEV